MVLDAASFVLAEVRPSERHRQPPVLRPDRTPGGGVLPGDQGRAVPEARRQRSLRPRGDDAGFVFLAACFF